MKEKENQYFLKGKLLLGFVLFLLRRKNHLHQYHITDRTADNTQQCFAFPKMEHRHHCHRKELGQEARRSGKGSTFQAVYHQQCHNRSWKHFAQILDRGGNFSAREYGKGCHT